MDKKILIGLLVVAGLYVGYRYISKSKVTAVKKETNDTGMATEKDGYDFYNKISTEGEWQYSKEGIGRFIKAYSENVTKAKHNEMMGILNQSKIDRSADKTKIIDDTLDNIVSKLK